ncbi:MAG: hypothetical protein A2W03_15005 [Candidatus Aminicenantes bacterium RBG_16_63_16]|nr:MAG: hypothetical protein A2W03_15005 [Candidatus Aminicenantes bacterium RBG_16_63_16]
MRIISARRVKAVSFVCLILLLGSGLFAAQEMALPPPLQYQLFLKILRYDRHFTAKPTTQVVIGILYQSGFRSSYEAMQAFSKAVQGTAQREFPNASIQAVPIDLDNQPDLETALAGSKADLMYIAPLRAMNLKIITSLSRAKKVITLTGVPDYAEKGVAVGVGLKGESPEIIINLPAAREEGSDFSSSLLKLARVIEQPLE